ncbi:citrulline utilization hydrolase CtlX [Parapedobacter sp. GCM10030251]|uniref:citrulline utilization hydrolase CtlX n=1 Tax=Parapedobacter sp. GCM10030251 TaxID=3273419 RepID=UPI00360EF031
MTLLMIRPAHFGYNPQTAINNAFQTWDADDHSEIQRKALNEFDAFVKMLRSHDVDVLVVQDTESPHTPDSIFPNNWISFHADGSLVLYPMFAENRRLERKPSVHKAIERHFTIRRTLDYTSYEAQGKFLEGTGSFVLDRVHQIAYACRSPRTDESLFQLFCKQMGYHPVIFDAFDEHGQPIYHTNVMMCVADRYAVVTWDSIADSDRPRVARMLENSGKTQVPITMSQMQAFAGNMLQIENKQGKRFLVMSTRAYRSLRPEQLEKLTKFNSLIHMPLDTIERNGGGSARCMMAEVYLPLNAG